MALWRGERGRRRTEGSYLEETAEAEVVETLRGHVDEPLWHERTRHGRRKRARARDDKGDSTISGHHGFVMNNIPPPLPSIEGDLLLDVLTRQSNRSSPSPPDNTEHGGAERLAELGHAVLSMTIMYILFHRTPFLSGADLSVCCRSKHGTARSMSSSPCHRISIKN